VGVLLEVVKMAALATVAALVASHWCGVTDTALVGVGVFYLLLVRVT
jgi:hypothetical protein